MSMQQSLNYTIAWLPDSAGYCSNMLINKYSLMDINWAHTYFLTSFDGCCLVVGGTAVKAVPHAIYINTTSIEVFFEFDHSSMKCRLTKTILCRVLVFVYSMCFCLHKATTYHVYSSRIFRGISFDKRKNAFA